MGAGEEAVAAGLVLGGAAGCEIPLTMSQMTMEATPHAPNKIFRRRETDRRGLCVNVCWATWTVGSIAGVAAILGHNYSVFLGWDGGAGTITNIGVALTINPLVGVGAIAAGFLLAVMMANAGGAWDNAKKWIETGQMGGKGSPAHKAAVVGDTVGDPFKDTSGPSLNILIKLMSIVSLVFAGAFGSGLLGF